MNNKELAKGTTLQGGKYTIERVIGEGGFGITYYARHNALGHYFAVKEFFISGYSMRSTLRKTVVLQGIDADVYQKYLQKFIEEAQTLARLDYPNIVRVVDIFEENNTAYIVMPFVEGQTLQQIVDKGGRLNYETAVNYIAQVAEAVAYIHERNILHRDIKPENIIVTPENRAVLIDFGSAREFVHDKTQQHTSMLTAGYAPLEQYSSNSRKGSYSDIYALGAVFYFALTGQKPMDAAARTTETMKEPREIEASIPAEANRTIMRAMELKPERRQQKVGEFMGELLNVNETFDTKKRGTKKDKKNWKTILFVLVYLVAYCVSVGVFTDKADNYIRDKAWNLRWEVSKKLTNFFKSQNIFNGTHLIIDTYYSNNYPQYNETKDMPESYFRFNATYKDYWNEKYGDIYRFFKTDSTNNNWEFFVAEQRTEESFLTYHMFPAFVGYRKQDNIYSYNYMPSIEKCIENAYEFWVNNFKSNFANIYENGSKRLIDNLISGIDNDYYYLNKEYVDIERHMGLFYFNRWMYNDYYKVFIGAKDGVFYEVKRNDEVINKDTMELQIKGIAIISGIFALVIFVHILSNRRNKNDKNG
jgi:serine/threonine protein kinase